MRGAAFTSDELLFLADRNLSEFSRTSALWDPRGEVELRDDIQLVASGTRFPAGMFNCLQALGTSPDAERAQRWLARAVAFFAARERGFTVYVRDCRDRVLADVCAAHSLQALEPAAPGMVLDAPVPVGTLPDGVRIVQSSTPAEIGDLVDVVAPAFEMLSLPQAVTHALFAHPSRILSPELACYVAYAGAVPAATVITLTTNGIAGLYWIATRPDMQRRGLADAITRRASNDAFARGAAAVVLQASPMGEPVYRRIGYRVITHYPRYYMTRENVLIAARAS